MDTAYCKVTPCNLVQPEDSILHSHPRENLNFLVLLSAHLLQTTSEHFKCSFLLYVQ